MHLPLPSVHYGLPSWKPLDPLANLSVVKEAAFWMFWYDRGVERRIDREPDPQYRDLLAQLIKLWAGYDLGQKPSTERTPFETPEDMQSAFDEAWQVYGSAVLTLIHKHRLRMDVSSFDLNGDGRVDTVYRITRLIFARTTTETQAPRLQSCVDGSGGPSTTEILFVSHHDDPALSRSFLATDLAEAYQSFVAGNERYIASGAAAVPSLGWVSRVTPAPTVDSDKIPRGARGISSELICQFERKVAK